MMDRTCIEAKFCCCLKVSRLIDPMSGDGQNRESHNLHQPSEVAQMGLDYNEAYSEYREWMDAVVSH